MTRFPKSVCAFLALSLSAGFVAGAEWRDLFDGKSLNGWFFDVKDYTHPHEIYSVRDGVLHVAGADRTVAVVRTVEEFGDSYDLEVEWRWPDEPGNSGCLLHCSTPRFMNVWPRSLEVQLQSGNAGDLIHIGETITTPAAQIPTDFSGRNQWKVRLRHNLTDDSENPPGEWNYMLIKVRRDEITVWVNEVKVNHGTELSARGGAICLQAEGANVEYRKVRIREW
ncbi:MAG: DUF1080 domain-containing protein [Opitutaceae bacterium]|nr:DUF1080 domain-containing protein [Opitutaceae bacterium]